MNLCDELTIRMLLERHGFHFSKSMGQNFLIDPQIPADIAAASQADETCGVLEIGPHRPFDVRAGSAGRQGGLH